MELDDIDVKKVYWDEIKNDVKKANFEFYEIVEAIHPGSDCPLYLLQFPYGELIGDHISQFLPLTKGGYIRLNDPQIPNELLKHLGYGKNDSPLGMILDKNFEIYVDLKNKKTTLPFRVQKPGDFLNYVRTLNINHELNYAPNGVLSMVSGARTTFVLPSIGCSNKFSKMCRTLKMREPKPTISYEHHSLFRAVLNQAASPWRASLIYFSETWIDNIKKNVDWYPLQKFFFKLLTKKSQYYVNLHHYNTAYSLILEKTNLKPNPYLFDTFKHLIDIMVGETPGFAPTTHENNLPLELLQQILIDAYGLKHVVPTIISPDVFNINYRGSLPIYYSLQIPTIRSYSPKSKNSSVMVDMRELQFLFSRISNELIKDNDYCSNTIIQFAFQNLSFSFFHNSNDIDGTVGQARNIIVGDQRYLYIAGSEPNAKIPSAEDAKFFRGCVKISWCNS